MLPIVEPPRPPIHFNPPPPFSCSVCPSLRILLDIAPSFTLFSNLSALSAIMDFLELAFLAWMGRFFLPSSPTAIADALR